MESVLFPQLSRECQEEGNERKESKRCEMGEETKETVEIGTEEESGKRKTEKVLELEMHKEGGNIEQGMCKIEKELV